MKLFKVATLVLVLGAQAATPAWAQFPGDVKSPGSYDPVGDARYSFQRWAPTDGVREAQQALRDQGYYDGPIDGMMTPQFRTAVWNFQRANKLVRSGRLDGPTMAALDLPATAAASPDLSPSFGSPSSGSHLDDVQAP